MEEADLVCFMVVQTEVDGNYIKSALEEQGIPVSMMGNEVSALGVSLDGEDDVQLFTLREHSERAKELGEELLSDSGEPIPAWTCKCGEEVDEGFGVCWSCGAPFPG